MMHLVVIRKELVAKNPGLVTAIYKGFCDAKDDAMKGYKFRKIFNNVDIMFPWFSNLIDEDVTVLGEDWWPYALKLTVKRSIPFYDTIMNKACQNDY